MYKINVCIKCSFKGAGREKAEVRYQRPSVEEVSNKRANSYTRDLEHCPHKRTFNTLFFTMEGYLY